MTIFIDVKSEQFKKFQQIKWLEKTKKYKGGCFKRMKKQLDRYEVTFYKTGFVIHYDIINMNEIIVTNAYPILSLYWFLHLNYYLCSMQ